jgi:hypothetical protein
MDNQDKREKLHLDPDDLTVEGLPMEDLAEVSGGGSYTCPATYTCPSGTCPETFTCPPPPTTP